MSKRKQKGEIAISELIAEALGDPAPPTRIVAFEEEISQQIEQIDAKLAENEMNKRQIEDVDAQLEEIDRRHSSGKIGLRQYRRDGIEAIDLLIRRFSLSHGRWLFSAHAIARSLRDMIDFGVANSPLLEPEEKLGDDDEKMWPFYGRWEVKWASVAASLFLQEYCRHSAAKAAGLIERKLRNANFRSERGSRGTPQAATIERWVREAVKTEVDRVCLQHGIVDLSAHIGVSMEELALVNETSVLEAFVEIVERSVVFPPPKRS